MFSQLILFGLGVWKPIRLILPIKVLLQVGLSPISIVCNESNISVRTLMICVIVPNVIKIFLDRVALVGPLLSIARLSESLIEYCLSSDKVERRVSVSFTVFIVSWNALPLRVAVWSSWWQRTRTKWPLFVLCCVSHFWSTCIMV